MSTRSKRFLVALGIVVVGIVAATVAVRLILTRERLMALIVPRVESAVGASITVGDIGVRFPFGFGVDMTDLGFRKTLPDSSELDFVSKTVTVRASLLSLIKRRPEVTAANIDGGAVAISGAGKKYDVTLRGLRSSFSMKPAGDSLAMHVRALVDSVTIAPAGGAPAAVLEDGRFEGDLETDRGFTMLRIRDGKAEWADLVELAVSGEVMELKLPQPSVSLTVELAEKPIAPIAARIRSFNLAALAPQAKPKPAPAGPPPEITGGTIAATVKVDGPAKQPLAMNTSFAATCTGLAMRMGTQVSIASLDASVTGAGTGLQWAALFPAPAKGTTAKDILAAWQSVGLEGDIHASGVEAAAPGSPFAISSLKAAAKLSRGDITTLSGDCLAGGSPLSFSGSMQSILPAAAELSLVAAALREKSPNAAPMDLSVLLDRMTIVPAATLEIKGRSFDVRPFAKPLTGGGKKDSPAEAPAAKQSAAPPAAGAILFLKSTTFTARLDSLITKEAVVTAIDLSGAIRDGLLSINPASFSYAGGSGKATVKSDLRKVGSVTSKVDFSLDGVEAGQALGRLHSLGGLLQGRFSVRTTAEIASGAGVNPLQALTAAGTALSTRGSVNLAQLLEPLAKIPAMTALELNTIDFNEWKGAFAIRDGRFQTDDWTVKSSRGAWSIKGSFGFDGSLDYAMRLVMPPDVQAQLADLDKYRNIVDLFRDASGNLVFDIALAGTAKNPRPSIDMSKARAKASNTIMDQLRNKANELIKKKP